MEPVNFCKVNFTRVEDLDEYYWWDLTNGSSIFCNYFPQCESTFAPDADIGGWGVSIWPSLLRSLVDCSLLSGHHGLHCNGLADHPDSSHQCCIPYARYLQALAPLVPPAAFSSEWASAFRR